MFNLIESIYQIIKFVNILAIFNRKNEKNIEKRPIFAVLFSFRSFFSVINEEKTGKMDSRKAHTAARSSN